MAYLGIVLKAGLSGLGRGQRCCSRASWVVLCGTRASLPHFLYHEHAIDLKFWAHAAISKGRALWQWPHECWWLGIALYAQRLLSWHGTYLERAFLAFFLVNLSDSCCCFSVVNCCVVVPVGPECCLVSAIKTQQATCGPRAPSA